MNRSLVHHALLAGALLLSVVSVAGGVLYLLGQLTVDAGGTAMQVGVGTTLLAAGLALSVGIWASRRSEHDGGGLIAAGAVPAAVCFWWTGVVPAIALPVAFLGMRRARRQARTERVVQ